MKVHFESKKFEKICEDEVKLSRKYGPRQAEEIITRIGELEAAENLYDISKIPQARLHPFKANWKGYFSVDLKHPYRMRLLPLNGQLSNKKSITEIKIVSLEDPHTGHY